ncbi:UNVERIFIED_CONTAM: AP2 domain transcription factor AP2V-2 [Hammondia hammondi]|eukprot:XP_008884155.1 AP2 domain transcription factor AP2V-2 [Hammondia hammondi]
MTVTRDLQSSLPEEANRAAIRLRRPQDDGGAGLWASVPREGEKENCVVLQHSRLVKRKNTEEAEQEEKREHSCRQQSDMVDLSSGEPRAVVPPCPRTGQSQEAREEETRQTSPRSGGDSASDSSSPCGSARTDCGGDAGEKLSSGRRVPKSLDRAEEAGTGASTEAENPACLARSEESVKKAFSPASGPVSWLEGDAECRDTARVGGGQAVHSGSTAATGHDQSQASGKIEGEKQGGKESDARQEGEATSEKESEGEAGHAAEEGNDAPEGNKQETASPSSPRVSLQAYEGVWRGSNQHDTVVICFSDDGGENAVDACEHPIPSLSSSAVSLASSGPQSSSCSFSSTVSDSVKHLLPSLSSCSSFSPSSSSLTASSPASPSSSLSSEASSVSGVCSSSSVSSSSTLCASPAAELSRSASALACPPSSSSSSSSSSPRSLSCSLSSVSWPSADLSPRAGATRRGSDLQPTLPEEGITHRTRRTRASLLLSSGFLSAAEASPAPHSALSSVECGGAKLERSDGVGFTVAGKRGRTRGEKKPRRDPRSHGEDATELLSEWDKVICRCREAALEREKRRGAFGPAPLASRLLRQPPGASLLPLVALWSSLDELAREQVRGGSPAHSPAEGEERSGDRENAKGARGVHLAEDENRGQPGERDARRPAQMPGGQEGRNEEEGEGEGKGRKGRAEDRREGTQWLRPEANASFASPFSPLLTDKVCLSSVRLHPVEEHSEKREREIWSHAVRNTQLGSSREDTECVGESETRIQGTSACGAQGTELREARPDTPSAAALLDSSSQLCLNEFPSFVSASSSVEFDSSSSASPALTVGGSLEENGTAPAADSRCEDTEAHLLDLSHLSQSQPFSPDTPFPAAPGEAGGDREEAARPAGSQEREQEAGEGVGSAEARRRPQAQLSSPIVPLSPPIRETKQVEAQLSLLHRLLLRVVSSETLSGMPSPSVSPLSSPTLSLALPACSVARKDTEGKRRGGTPRRPRKRQKTDAPARGSLQDGEEAANKRRLECGRGSPGDSEREDAQSEARREREGREVDMETVREKLEMAAQGQREAHRRVALASIRYIRQRVEDALARVRLVSAMNTAMKGTNKKGDRGCAKMREGADEAPEANDVTAEQREERQMRAQDDQRREDGHAGEEREMGADPSREGALPGDEQGEEFARTRGKVEPIEDKDERENSGDTRESGVAPGPISIDSSQGEHNELPQARRNSGRDLPDAGGATTLPFSSSAEMGVSTSNSDSLSSSSLFLTSLSSPSSSASVSASLASSCPSSSSSLAVTGPSSASLSPHFSLPLSEPTTSAATGSCGATQDRPGEKATLSPSSEQPTETASRSLDREVRQLYHLLTDGANRRLVRLALLREALDGVSLFIEDLHAEFPDLYLSSLRRSLSPPKTGLTFFSRELQFLEESGVLGREAERQEKEVEDGREEREESETKGQKDMEEDKVVEGWRRSPRRLHAKRGSEEKPTQETQAGASSPSYDASLSSSDASSRLGSSSASFSLSGGSSNPLPLQSVSLPSGSRMSSPSSPSCASSSRTPGAVPFQSPQDVSNRFSPSSFSCSASLSERLKRSVNLTPGPALSAWLRRTSSSPRSSSSSPSSSPLSSPSSPSSSSSPSLSSSSSSSPCSPHCSSFSGCGSSRLSWRDWAEDPLHGPSSRTDSCRVERMMVAYHTSLLEATRESAYQLLASSLVSQDPSFLRQESPPARRPRSVSSGSSRSIFSPPSRFPFASSASAAPPASHPFSSAVPSFSPRALSVSPSCPVRTVKSDRWWSTLQVLAESGGKRRADRGALPYFFDPFCPPSLLYSLRRWDPPAYAASQPSVLPPLSEVSSRPVVRATSSSTSSSSASAPETACAAEEEAQTASLRLHLSRFIPRWCLHCPPQQNPSACGERRAGSASRASSQRREEGKSRGRTGVPSSSTASCSPAACGDKEKSKEASDEVDLYEGCERVRGVAFCRTTKYWVCSKMENGKQKCRYFSTKQFGFDGARRHAILQRHEWKRDVRPELLAALQASPASSSCSSSSASGAGSSSAAKVKADGRRADEGGCEREEREEEEGHGGGSPTRREERSERGDTPEGTVKKRRRGEDEEARVDVRGGAGRDEECRKSVEIFSASWREGRREEKGGNIQGGDGAEAPEGRSVDNEADEEEERQALLGISPSFWGVDTGGAALSPSSTSVVDTSSLSSLEQERGDSAREQNGVLAHSSDPLKSEEKKNLPAAVSSESSRRGRGSGSPASALRSATATAGEREEQILSTVEALVQLSRKLTFNVKIPGIGFHKGVESWVCMWKDFEGRSVSRYFRCARFGFRRSYRMSVCTLLRHGTPSAVNKALAALKEIKRRRRECRRSLEEGREMWDPTFQVKGDGETDEVPEKRKSRGSGACRRGGRTERVKAGRRVETPHNFGAGDGETEAADGDRRERDEETQRLTDEEHLEQEAADHAGSAVAFVGERQKRRTTRRGEEAKSVEVEGQERQDENEAGREDAGGRQVKAKVREEELAVADARKAHGDSGTKREEAEAEGEGETKSDPEVAKSACKREPQKEREEPESLPVAEGRCQEEEQKGGATEGKENKESGVRVHTEGSGRGERDVCNQEETKEHGTEAEGGSEQAEVKTGDSGEGCEDKPGSEEAGGRLECVETTGREDKRGDKEGSKDADEKGNLARVDVVSRERILNETSADTSSTRDESARRSWTDPNAGGSVEKEANSKERAETRVELRLRRRRATERKIASGENESALAQGRSTDESGSTERFGKRERRRTAKAEAALKEGEEKMKRRRRDACWLGLLQRDEEDEFQRALKRGRRSRSRGEEKGTEDVAWREAPAQNAEANAVGDLLPLESRNGTGEQCDRLQRRTKAAASVHRM